jgi:hypothetical protein
MLPGDIPLGKEYATLSKYRLNILFYLKRFNNDGIWSGAAGSLFCGDYALPAWKFASNILNFR